MRVYRILRPLVVGILATIGVVVMSVTPAQAANTGFFNCVDEFCNTSYTQGTITWFNRTAGVTGSVVDIGPGSTQAIFKAYAGSNQIGSTQTRTANDESGLGSPRGFDFTMGDTNLVGGINKITIQVCWSGGLCGGVNSYFK